jgi:hypothetical protein
MSAYGGPEINDSGLVLALDAANTRSAPASTTWTDLSGNANNGTLTNGPVYIFGRSAISCTGSTGNRLEIAHTTALNLNGGAYTIECWVYPTTSFATYSTLLGKQSLFTAGYSLWVNSGYPAFGLNGGYNSITSSTILTLNNWHHIAVVSDGSTYTRLFLNGVQVGTSATLLTTSTTSLLTINGNKAGTNWDADYPFRGLISDVRIVKGTAVYTGAFTRPSAPLTAIANTQLLTCNDPVIKDSSLNALTISTVGTVAVDNTTVSNVLFDGTNDYADCGYNSSIYNLTQNLTVEVWVRWTGAVATSGNGQWIVTNVDVSTTNGGFQLGYIPGTGFYFGTYGNLIAATYSFVPVINTWYNLTGIKSSSSGYFIYLNGVSVATNVNLTAGGAASRNLRIAHRERDGAGGYFPGNVSSVKIHNTALTADQVLQNYNALRGRYGL